MLRRRFWMRGSGSALAALAAFVTTLCCLGLPALVGFFSAPGAGFLINDRYLEPLLIGTLALALLIAGLHLRQHHLPWPFILSVVAAMSVFFAIYGIRLLPLAGGSDSMGDHMADGMPRYPPGVLLSRMERSSSCLGLRSGISGCIGSARAPHALRWFHRNHERSVSDAPHWRYLADCDRFVFPVLAI